MQSLTSRITRTAKASSSLRAILLNEAPSSSSWLAKRRFSAFSLQQHGQNTQIETIQEDILKWGSIGYCRTLGFATGFPPLQPKPLDSIMCLDRAKNRSAEGLASICDDYHLGRGYIGLTMTAKLFRLLEQRSLDCLYFVIPLWTGSCYTTMFCQAQLPYMLFTGLEDYKARGAQAAPYFTASFYKEFAESKDLVLIRGDVVRTSKLTGEEAKWLLETTLTFYVNDVRYKLVECFNKGTHDFEFKDVLRALDIPIYFFFD